MRKTRISVALAAALAGVGASTQVMAVNKSADNIGDAFIGPYYSVRAGWTTDFTVINTSDSTVPVKVRFHEANNSRDVLDFIVVLSPQDMVQAIVAEGPNGPRLSFPARTEASCVVPQPVGRAPNGSGGYFDFSNASYTGENQDYPQGAANDEIYGSIDRAREGYFTIIEMGAAEPGAEEDQTQIVPYNSNHAHLDCAKVIAAFNDPGDHAAILKTYDEFGRNVNALKGSYSLTHIPRGVQGSSEMVTLANFATEFSTLNRTPTWSLWAERELAAYDAALDAATANMTTAYNALKAKDTQIVNTYAGCTSNLENNGTKNQFPDDYPQTGAAVPCGTAQDQQAWIDLATTYNDTVDSRDDAQAAYDAAFLTIASTPVANLIHAQVDPYWNFPNLDSGDLIAVNNWDGEYLKYSYCDNEIDPRGCDFYGVSFGGAFIRGVDAVTMLLMSSDLINEWAVNSVTGASSDFVVTFPTKRFYTDWDHIYQGIGNYPVLLEIGLTGIYDIIHGKIPTGAIPPFAQMWNDTTFQSCDQVGYNVFNRDEGIPPGVVPGTSPQSRVNFCDEVNILYFGGESMLDSNVAQKVSQAAPLGSNGWLGVDLTASFKTAQFSNSQWHPVIGEFFDFGQFEQDGVFFDYVVGMPGVGFSFKQRNLGQAASYGGIVEHSYVREFGVHDVNIFDLFPITPGGFGLIQQP
jgi:hypothetical protein